MICSWSLCFFFFKQKTAYEMRISDWSSDVCSSDLRRIARAGIGRGQIAFGHAAEQFGDVGDAESGAIGAAQTEAVADHPVEAGLVVPVAAEQVIVRLAHRAARRPGVAEGLVRENPDRPFQTGCLRGARSRNRIRLVGLGVAQPG